MPSSVRSARINKFSITGNTPSDDVLAIESPLEIRLSGQTIPEKEKSISITMRTPGHDWDLATGFLFTEGIIDNYNSIESITVPAENVIVIHVSKDTNVNLQKLQRHFYTSSSCGVCGKGSIEAIYTLNGKAKVSDFTIDPTLLCSLPERLRKEQSVFDQTGGLHASAIFDLQGNLQLLREDVGRHNALDKVIGSAFRQKQLPLDKYILLLSGRASFELIQKAAMAGIGMVAAIGAPSSLAVELANDCGMTLCGFLKNDRFNIYSGNQRIQPTSVAEK